MSSLFYQQLQTKLPNRKVQFMLRPVLWLVCLGLCVCAPATHAGNVYVFKDKKGNVLLTNVVNKKNKPKGKGFHKYTKKIKVTWYKDTNVHEYKNWGKNEYSVLPKYTKNRSGFDHLIARSANRHGIDAALMKAIMHTESGFNPRARSPVGAQGLMQLMPATAKQYGVKNAWNPAQNIEGAAKYLKYLKKLFKGNTKLMLAGYNAGQGNVLKYGGIPPFKETQNYVRKVTSRYHKLYKNKSFVVRSRSQRITPRQLGRVVAANPINRYTKNNTHYLRTGSRQNNTKKYIRKASYRPRYNNINTNQSNRNSRVASLASSQQDSSYNASAFEALRKGRSQ